MDLLISVISNCHSEVIGPVSLFSAITVFVCVFLSSKGDWDLLSHFKEVEVSVSSILGFSFNTFAD